MNLSQAIYVAVLLALCGSAFSQEELPRVNVTHFPRVDGDELIYQTRLYSLPTPEPDYHVAEFEWSTTTKLFTDILVNVPETVRIIYFNNCIFRFFN